MASDWEESTLLDIADIVMGQSPSGDSCNFNGVGVPLLNGPTEFDISHPTAVQFTTDAKKLSRPDDILFCVRGSTTGRMNWSDKVYALGRGLAAIRHKNGSKYKYYLKSLIDYNLPELLAAATGSTFPNVSKDQLLGIRIKVPTLEEQRAISDVFACIEQKIELNHRMNDTLQGIAQALFKSWFVDFDPVKAKAEGREPEGLSGDIAALFPDNFAYSPLGQFPQGWEIKPLGEYVTVKRGGSPRPIQDYLSSEGLPWVKISDATAVSSPYLLETKQYIKESGLNKTILLRKGALILSNSATPGLPKFLNLDACIHDGWLYFPQKKVFGDYYLYQLFLVLKDTLISKGNGSVFTNLKTDILKSQLVLLPPYNLLVQYEIIAKTIFEKILANEEETKTVSQLRDSLLSRLISGKLRVDEASDIMEAVTL